MSNYLKLTDSRLSVDAITELASSAKCGAISLFVGTTRDNCDGKKVMRLEYEAYEAMALKTLEDICREVRARWTDVENIVIYHRLGAVPVQEASIVIAVSSPHRLQAIHATEWCIENVKKSVTIWKKEIYTAPNDGLLSFEWKENKESTKKIINNYEPPVVINPIPPHLIQVRATNLEIDERIRNFTKRKREEINLSNINEFCVSSNNEDEASFSCARIDAVLQKRKDSRGHLQVRSVLNGYYHRDQTNSTYLTKYMPANGVEERVANLEQQLSLKTSTPPDIYRRLKELEERMLHLEAISPEYIKLWDKFNVASSKTIGRKKKKVFSIDEIDCLIAEAKVRVEEEKRVPKNCISIKNIQDNE